jgi:hypothetical protein
MNLLDLDAIFNPDRRAVSTATGAGPEELPPEWIDDYLEQVAVLAERGMGEAEAQADALAYVRRRMKGAPQ